MTQAAVDALVDLLDLEPIEVNLFRGVSPSDARLRVFGGQVAGQALVAAGRTVEQGQVHSLHAYFLRPGDPRAPILYQVDRIRDGRSFTTRRVVAVQHGQAIFNLSASFHRHEPEPQLEHQVAAPEAPDPETLPAIEERIAGSHDLPTWLVDLYGRPRAIETRFVTASWVDRPRDGAPLPPRHQVWIRATGKLPDDPLLHACVVAYASDLTLLDTTLLPHGMRTWDVDRVMVASLDHAMWFHRPFRADEWLLYEQESPSAAGARALARGLIFTSTGELAVSVAQEGLVRLVTPRPGS